MPLDVWKNLVPEPKRKIGLPWYNREDYPDIRSMMADRHNLAPTYEQWLAAAENNENVGKQAGLDIERILIEPSRFARWCDAEGLAPDSAARMRYVAHVQETTAKP
ncbi:hypothetical protein [Microvirga pakistanensis]|uniref:hypothetical protein n=1 Tax=Microvirga pakistanensis TaxID=1682650 RepID=UPI001FCECD8B|nr:hypothetical protein [Microvirga pakistanensis]